MASRKGKKENAPDETTAGVGSGDSVGDHVGDDAEMFAEGDGGPNGMPLFVDEGEGEELKGAKVETARAQIRIAENAIKGEEAIEQVRRLEPDLIKRAKALAALQAFDFPDQKAIRTGDNIVMQALPTDQNRWVAFEALFGNGDDRPHVDTFRGRLVDHRGDIIDERYPMLELVGALAAAGLKGTAADICRRSFKEWALGLQFNDLIRSFETQVPAWDAKSRLETQLIELFECFDTPLNRSFSKYFWLSVYCRIMYPGCFAPMVLSLFGAQNCGKSYMAKLLCRVLTANPESDSVQLDLSGDKMEFLREITGNSIIASVGEMTGFNRGDLNKIKDFITRTGDNMHFKYEGHFTQPRQWVTVMDGNKYEGLQRDETGNRRFYPMFVGQRPDKDGQPSWEADYTVNYTGFEEDVWQLMAEARDWLSANGGIKGYELLTGKVIKQVAEFSRNEMARDRGTIRDESLDTFLIPALQKCKVLELNRAKNKGVWVSSSEIVAKVALVSRNRCDVKLNHLPPKMALIGGEKKMIDNVNGYMFSDVFNHNDYLKALRGPIDEEDVELSATKVIDPTADDF